MVNQPSAASSFTDHGIQVSSFIGRSVRPGPGVPSDLSFTGHRTRITTHVLGCFLDWPYLLTSFLRCFAVLLQKDSSISATRYFAPIEENASKPDYKVARTYGRKRSRLYLQSQVKKSVLTGAQYGRH